MSLKRLSALGALLSLAIRAIAGDPAPPPTKAASRTPAAPLVPSPIDGVRSSSIEVRADGRAYASKTLPRPFSGLALTTFPDKADKVERATQYQEGLKHGRDRLYSRRGFIREETEWVEGVAKKRWLYYPDGKLKAEMETDAAGEPFGTHRRFHPNGQKAIENRLGRHATPEGVERRYNSKGQLMAEYQLEKGVITAIIAETEEGKASRENESNKGQ